MQPPYIPAKDADFENWLNNFSTLLTAAPTTYGLTAPDAVTVAASYSAWNAAYILATNPATRTSSTIAQKDVERASATAVVRPFAIAIKLNTSVSDLDKTNIGVNLIVTTRTPIPPIITNPAMILVAATPGQHQLQFRDSATPTSKKKPFGAIGLEVWRAVGVAPAVSPDAAEFYQTWTKSPNTSTFDPADVGKYATYFARWTTRSGPGGTAMPSPWSAPLVAVVI